MATLKIENIDDVVVAHLRAVAARHQKTPEQEAADILSAALRVTSSRGSWVARAKEIAAMSPAPADWPDAVELLREDRSR